MLHLVYAAEVQYHHESATLARRNARLASIAERGAPPPQASTRRPVARAVRAPWPRPIVAHAGAGAPC